MTACLAQEMQRALFIFAKLNPGLRYVQGMNELLSPLYHAFRSDASHAQHAEADAFFCFVELVSECRDNFTQQLVRKADALQAGPISSQPINRERCGPAGQQYRGHQGHDAALHAPAAGCRLGAVCAPCGGKQGESPSLAAPAWQQPAFKSSAAASQRTAGLHAPDLWLLAGLASLTDVLTLTTSSSSAAEPWASA